MGDHEKESTGGGEMHELPTDDVFQYAPEDKANKISFHQVCSEVLEKMHNAQNTDARLNLLSPILSTLGRQSAFPFLRLVLPKLDDMRGNYGVKTAKLAKMFAKMYFPDPRSKSYQRLVHHVDPAVNPSPDDKWQIAGDFPLTLEYVLQNKACLDKTTASLGEVNELLDRLTRAKGDGDREKVLGIFRQNFSPMNQKWLVRIILKDLKIRLKKDSVLAKFHPDALDTYNKTISLRKVCSSFIGRHSSVRANSVIKVFTHISPMLAKNFFYRMDRIVPSFQGRAFCMDVKLDGERMMCHKDGDKVEWFTRKGTSYTSRYGPALDPYIIKGVAAHTCILDGEVVTWDDSAGKMMPFGHNRTYAKEEADGEGNGNNWLFYVVFDIIYVRGGNKEEVDGLHDIVRDAVKDSRTPCAPGTDLTKADLTELPLDARRRVLRAVVGEGERHRLEIVKSRDVEAGDETERKKQLKEFFEMIAIELNEEGLVVKDLSSRYLVGEKSRNDAKWVKMKPEYSDQTADMDLLILGGAFASGKKKSGLLSKFILGVAVPREDGGPPTQFWPITRVGSGYTIAQLEDLHERTKGKWKSFDSPPPHFECSSARVLKKNDGVAISRWIAPEDSFCVEIKCMEIVKSSDWPGVNCTARFPRITRIRYDKDFEGCLDTTELAEVQARPRSSAPREGDEADGKRRKGMGSGRRGKGSWKGKGASARQVSELFAVGGGGGGEVETSVFVTKTGTALEMCVIPGTGFSTAPLAEDDDVDLWWASAGSKRKAVARGEYEEMSKQELEDLIVRNGGIVTANPREITSFVIVGDKNTVTAKNLIAAGDFNVAGHRWVLQCVERGSYDFPSFQQVRALSRDVKKELSSSQDEYGDSYTQTTDATALSKLLLNIPARPRGAEKALLPWSSPMMEMDEQDRATLMESPEFIFADSTKSLIYCDLFPDLGTSDLPPPGDANEDKPSTRVEIPYNALTATAAAIRLHGGDVAFSLHAGVTHVIVDPDDTSRQACIRERIRDIHGRPGNNFHVRLITSEWVWWCLELGRLEPPLDEHRVMLPIRL